MLTNVDPSARELPAGRELDALVAEKVMGWRSWDARFKPSADWEAMRLVVERLVALGYIVFTDVEASGARCCIRGDYVAGDTLPHAVCLAALAVVADHV